LAGTTNFVKGGITMSGLINHGKNWEKASAKIEAKRKAAAAKPKRTTTKVSVAAKVSTKKAKVAAKVSNPVVTKTHEGGLGFKPEYMTELFTLATNSMWNGDTFYEKEDARLNRFHQLCEACSQDEKGRLFLASLAIYAREQMDLRSTPAMLAAELYLNYNPWKHEAANRIWLRGDEHLETMAYCNKLLGCKYPKALLKNVANRLNNMSQISFVKYKGEGRTISQRDALIVSHPFPKDDFHNVAFKWLIHGTKSLNKKEKALAGKLVDEAATWERSLSDGGATKENWEELLKEGKLGYMALLRNLRNICQAKVSKNHIKYVVNTLTDPEEVKRSRLLPYRFYSAYNALCVPSSPSGGYYSQRYVPKMRDTSVPQEIYDAVERAMDISMSNMEMASGKTLVLLDVSGSMTDPLSKESKISRMEAAFPIAAALAKGGAELWKFNDHSEQIHFCADDSILGIINHVIRSGVGGGTAIGNAIVSATRDTRAGLRKFDRIVILTDEQSADNSDHVLAQYLAIHPMTKVYVINLAGNKEVTFDPRSRNIVRLGGFSDKVIDMMNSVESPSSIDHVIKTVGLTEKTSAFSPSAR
jgi:hypothetical protein